MGSHSDRLAIAGRLSSVRGLGAEAAAASVTNQFQRSTHALFSWLPQRVAGPQEQHKAAHALESHSHKG